ncbi:MAG: hypothetical protein Q7U60_00795 [Candidatus Methanoperedens sp.]|nr:hypothetical protein [Candidatus Methanoperedens sp.]
MRKALGERMKQQDAYKLLAAFMILIMIIVPVAYVVTSPRSDTTQQVNEQQLQLEKYNPEYWVVNSPFDSISDALKVTPVGAVSASYADIESMTPQMIQWVRTQGLPIVNEVDSIYKSNTTGMYYSKLQDGSFLLLSTMFPEKNDFEYIAKPEVYPPILVRQEQQYYGLYNILGSPAIFAPPQTAIDVLQILYSQNKTATGYDRYEGLLNKTDAAPYQKIDSNVSFADQFYMGIRETNGNYERTTVYLNLNSSALKKLNQLKANSTQNGFTDYYLNRSGNYTTVKIISPDMFKVLNEEVS